MLLDTFDPYKPAVIPWPRLDAAALARLTALPFWGLAVETESETSMRMQLYADSLADPLLREAVALNAFEERRHKDVLLSMLRFYGIDVEAEADFPPPADPEWAYMQTGYGECFVSFFAFGLFRLARDSGYFPAALVEVFEPVIQEEARHILFFVNWAAYTQARRPLLVRPAFLCRRARAIGIKAWNRLKLAKDADNRSSMTIKGHESMGIDISPGALMDLCLRENERRMARYDERLVRPRLVPRLVRAARPFLGRG